MLTTASLSRAGFVVTAASLGAVQVWLLLGQGVLFTLAVLLWLAVVWRERALPETPPFFVPLLVYGALTLVSAALSASPVESLVDTKQLVLFLMVPVVARFARGWRALTTLDVIIGVGSAAALYGVVQANMLGYDNLSQRPTGSLTHYMTYSGVLMVVTCAAVARLVFVRREWIWPAVALPALIMALEYTLTRSAYIGVGVGLTVLLALRSWKLALVVPVVAAALVLVAPGAVRSRVESIFDPNDPTGRDRLAMLAVGRGMVADHPFFGVGPDQVKHEYVKYRPAVYTNETNPHLHNVPVQIAAERGLPALAAWLWFVVAAARGLFRQALHGPSRALAAAGAASLVAICSAGLFEYNFGDSEVLMLLLGLMTLPSAAGSPAEARRGEAGAAE